ncbi:MAG: hypothetical protein KF761_14115 [Salinibacterium sp.]|nr:hypothetical protein [Salinibacterium sp.]
MSASLRVLTAASVALLLAGCTLTQSPAVTTPSPAAGSSSTPKPTASVSAAPEPETVDAADYLIDGTPFIADQDGSWKGHYAFFTDETATVRCDVYIFSGDSGGVNCAVTAGNQGLVTYALPTPECGSSSSNQFDGYSVGINFKVFDNGNSGFTGCGVGNAFATAPGNELPTPLVLHDNQTLVVNSPVYLYTCTVAAGAATCTESYSGASIEFGLGIAQFQG